MDWAEEQASTLLNDDGMERRNMIAWVAESLRRARADGEASGERKGRASGMREAADYVASDECEGDVDFAKFVLLDRASQIEKGQT